MVWSDDKKIIFIHVPKCGGTTVEYELKLNNSSNGYGIVDGKARQHWTWKDYINHLGEEKYNKYHKFSIVRHPYTRIVSEYYWCFVPGHGARYESLDSFIDFCADVVERKAYSETVFNDHYMPQHLYIFENGELKVNELYKLEEYDKVVKYLNSLGVENVGKHETGRYPKIELTQKQRMRVYQIYSEDFRLLNYKR